MTQFPEFGNRLIERLPHAARGSLLSLCSAYPLVPLEVLGSADVATRHIYFPTQGFISLVTANHGSPGVEAGMVGSEGMLGAHVALSVLKQPLHALVQGAGSALRIGTRAFLGELARSPALKIGIDKYLYVLMRQLITSSTCLRFHKVAPRLARWLLMSHDRARSDDFQVTHEFLARMLGVRRAGVTVAANDFQSRGLIEYRRGAVRVLDRPGLEFAACKCYACNRKAYGEQFD